MSEATATATGERLSAREAAIARRHALSQFGKKAVAATGANALPVVPAGERRETPVDTHAIAADPARGGAPTGSAAARTEESHSAFIAPPVSAARQRRMDQSLKGRGEAPKARPTGRVRPAPPKVEEGTTLAGAGVTGNQVERSARVTGNETGGCRAVTGTEYIGVEQYRGFCSSVPEPGPAKVGVTTTSHGKRITGTEVGRGSRVTGDEPGTCKRVTGTEYQSVEQLATECGIAAEPHPQKVGAGMTAARNPVTGSDHSRKTWVTGQEVGAGRAITGTAYADPHSIRAPREDAAKKKHEITHTAAGVVVNGPGLGPAPDVTGAAAGACQRVTGSQYVGREDFVSYCRAMPYQPPAKLGPARLDDVSGSRVGRSALVTGDEQGACKTVTGTAYIGAAQYAEFCAARTAVEAIQRARHGKLAAPLAPPPAPEAPPFFRTWARHPRAQGPEGTPSGRELSGNSLDQEAPRHAGEFSVSSPARSARGSEISRITGSSCGGGNRITGSMARATGLISGTPEFRYREDAATAAAAAPVAEAAPERITGGGRERLVTGDNWSRGDRITGTEGKSATRRNPTLRGTAPANAAPAARETERPAPAPSRVTGSSGNAQGGAAVTLSGGARG